MIFIYLCLLLVVGYMLAEPFWTELSVQEERAFQNQEKAMLESDMKFKKQMVKQSLQEAQIDFETKKMVVSDFEEAKNEIYREALEEMSRKPKP